MRISDGSSDVFSSDLSLPVLPWRHWPAFPWSRDGGGLPGAQPFKTFASDLFNAFSERILCPLPTQIIASIWSSLATAWLVAARWKKSWPATAAAIRSEEHTSELQSLMRISYAVFCLKKK